MYLFFRFLRIIRTNDLIGKNDEERLMKYFSQEYEALGRFR